MTQRKHHGGAFKARLATALARLGPGTPLNSYIAEFGEPVNHFADETAMVPSWSTMRA